MNHILLANGESQLEICLERWDGDAYISVVVNSKGFKGSNDLHILDAEFRKFCRDLIELQRDLVGKATMESVSPGELDIRIQPFDKLGHISIYVKTGYHVLTGHTANWHSVEVGFEIEPNELDKVSQVPWVVEYAA